MLPRIATPVPVMIIQANSTTFPISSSASLPSATIPSSSVTSSPLSATLSVAYYSPVSDVPPHVENAPVANMDMKHL